MDRRVGDPHLGHTGGPGRGFGGRAAVRSGDQHMDVAAQPGRGAQRGQCRALQGGVVMFGDDEDGSCQITRASFLSLSTSSATEPTLMPAWRLGGSATLSVFRRGVTSTPRSAGLRVSSGFFLAFMMLGSEA